MITKTFAENEERVNKLRKHHSERFSYEPGCESRPTFTSSPQGSGLTSLSLSLLIKKRDEHALPRPATMKMLNKLNVPERGTELGPGGFRFCEAWNSYNFESTP